MVAVRQVSPQLVDKESVAELIAGGNLFALHVIEIRNVHYTLSPCT